MTAEVSVVVPTYNRADLIGETLDSILRQSCSPAEVIVVDDGSSDHTESVVLSLGPKVRYIKIQNSGECCARNVGVTHSSMPLICFCDSDDLWHPEKLKLQIQLFEENPQLGYSFTNFKTIVDGQWSTLTKFDTSPEGYWDLPCHHLNSEVFVIKDSLFARLLRHQPVFPSTLMMRRSFFEASGRWNEALGRTPSVDLEYHLRCAVSKEIGVVKTPVVGIRKHASNFSGDSLKTTIGEVAILRYVLKNNPHAREFQSEIIEQVQLRSAKAAEAAFAAGNMRLASELLNSVPYTHRSWRLHVKSLISRMPSGIAQSLQKSVVAIRSY